MSPIIWTAYFKSMLSRIFTLPFLLLLSLIALKATILSKPTLQISYTIPSPFPKFWTPFVYYAVKINPYLGIYSWSLTSLLFFINITVFCIRAACFLDELRYNFSSWILNWSYIYVHPEQICPQVTWASSKIDRGSGTSLCTLVMSV